MPLLVHARFHGYLWGPSPSAEKVEALKSFIYPRGSQSGYTFESPGEL